MEVVELLRRGELQAAIEAATNGVRRAPADIDQRYSLVALLAMQGELDRADSHLEAIGSLRPDLAFAVSVYRSCLEAEEERRRVFDGKAEPGRPPEPSAIVDRRITLRRCLLGAGDAAAAMSACADEPPVAGTLDGRPFAALVDHDDALGGVLEVFASGRYLWLPFANLRSLSFEPPKGLFDLLWVGCNFEDHDGRRALVHVPVLYAGSHTHADPLVRCGRKTEWSDEAGVAFRGFGPRVLRADDQEVPLLDVRRIDLTRPAGAAHG
ncbi:MAG: hypothetical protein IT455_16375 [Planctomycetes bacterium]|nr:hypothetical protein [Planctomycetota bacterium]